MGTGVLINGRLFGPGKALLIGLSAVLACLLLAPTFASARPFAPQVGIGVQTPDPNQTANVAPQLTQGLTRYPQSFLPLSGVSSPYDYGEQAIQDLSLALPKSWRVNGESMIEPCDLLSHLDAGGNGYDRGDMFNPNAGTPCSQSAPSSLLGTVDANAFLLGFGWPNSPVPATGQVWYVRSDQFYNEPGLGGHPEWVSEFVDAGNANDKGSALPVVLAVTTSLLGGLIQAPPIYIESSLQPGTFRIHADINDIPPLLPGDPGSTTAYLGDMDLTFNPGMTEAAGPFRTPPAGVCSDTQIWDYFAQSYADTLFMIPWGGHTPPGNDPSQTYPDEGTVQTTTPALTGCGANTDSFDSPKISKIETTTTDAGANPDMTISMTRANGDSFLKGLKITFPEGVIGSPYATSELCSGQQAQQNQCPAGSKVGSATTEVSVFDTRHIAINGDVYQAPVQGSEKARFLTVLNTPPIGDLQTVVLPATLDILPGATGIVAEVPSMPTEFDVRKVSFTFNGSTGADRQHPLMINPTACDPVDFKVDFTSEVGQTHGATAPYQATNCDKLPFNPSFDVALTCSGPHCLPGISITTTQPYGDAAMSASKVTIPASFPLNLASRVKPCSLADQATETCPAESVMGNAVIESPLAIEPLQGQLFLAEQGAGQSDVFRRIHVRVTGLIDMSLDADLKMNPSGGFDTVISGMPQVPISKMQLNLNGGDDALVYAPYDCGSQQFKAEFTSHAGQTATKSSTPEISGDDCAPRLNASVSPNRAGAKSKLTLNVRPNQGTVLKSAKFNLGSLKVRGLGKSGSARKLSSLKLTPKSGRGTLSTRKAKMSLRKKSLSLKGLPNEALRELDLVFNRKRTGALRNPKKCGKVKIVGRFVDTKNQAYKTTAKLRIACAKKRR